MIAQLILVLIRVSSGKISPQMPVPKMLKKAIGMKYFQQRFMS
jgi:hypothetical protein